MSVIERLILFGFGGVLIASCFVLVNFSSVAINEAREARSLQRKVLRYRPFVLAISLATIALGLMLLSAIRAVDGLTRGHFGGTWPAGVMVAVLIILVGKSGFQWGATFRRHLAQWWIYLGLLASWGIVVMLAPLAHV